MAEIEVILQRDGAKEAFCLLSISWSSCHSTSHYPVHVRPPKGIADVLVVSSDNRIYLFTIVSESHTEEQRAAQMNYMYETGKRTKRLLLKGREGAGHDLCVQCFLYNTSTSKGDITRGVGQSQIQEATTAVFHTEDDLGFIQRMLAAHLIDKHTFRNAFGEDYTYHLCARQAKVKFASVSTKASLVWGAPGTGKSTVAMAIAKQISLLNGHVLYVCTTEAFQKFVDFQNVGATAVVTCDVDLKQLTGHGLQDSIKCVIVDDAHNIDCHAVSIQPLLEFIKRKRDRHLYVFADNDYQCFERRERRFTDMVVMGCLELKIVYDVHHLTEVHRNSRRVMSFLAASVADIVEEENFMTCMNTLVGDDIEVIGSPDPFLDAPQNAVVQQVLKLTDLDNISAGPGPYLLSEIAILVDTDSCAQDIDLMKQIVQRHVPHASVNSASDYPRSGIIVDSVDNFSGLDAAVCLFVLSSSRVGKEGCRTITNPRYRAFLVSRAIHKGVFVIPKIDVEVFRTLLFDKTQVRIKRYLVPKLATFPRVQHASSWTLPYSHCGTHLGLNFVNFQKGSCNNFRQKLPLFTLSGI